MYKISSKFTDSFVEMYSEQIHQLGMPVCYVCDKPLKKGDQVDNVWPFSCKNNICQKCIQIKAVMNLKNGLKLDLA